MFLVFTLENTSRKGHSRKNNKKNTPCSPTINNHRPAAKTPLWQVERHPSEQGGQPKLVVHFFLRGGVSILSSTVQTRSNTKYHLIEGLSIVNIFHHPKIASVGEVLSSNHPDHYSLYRSLFCHPIDDAGRRFFGRLFMDNIRVFGVRIDRLFQNLEKALHIFASTS